MKNTAVFKTCTLATTLTWAFAIALAISSTAQAAPLNTCDLPLTQLGSLDTATNLQQLAHRLSALKIDQSKFDFPKNTNIVTPNDTPEIAYGRLFQVEPKHTGRMGPEFSSKQPHNILHAIDMAYQKIINKNPQFFRDSNTSRGTTIHSFFTRILSTMGLESTNSEIRSDLHFLALQILSYFNDLKIGYDMEHKSYSLPREMVAPLESDVLIGLPNHGLIYRIPFLRGRVEGQQSITFIEALGRTSQKDLVAAFKELLDFEFQLNVFWGNSGWRYISMNGTEVNQIFSPTEKVEFDQPRSANNSARHATATFSAKELNIRLAVSRNSNGRGLVVYFQNLRNGYRAHVTEVSPQVSAENVYERNFYLDMEYWEHKSGLKTLSPVKAIKIIGSHLYVSLEGIGNDESQPAVIVLNLLTGKVMRVIAGDYKEPRFNVNQGKHFREGDRVDEY